jgi:CHAT domain-containing protein
MKNYIFILLFLVSIIICSKLIAQSNEAIYPDSIHVILEKLKEKDSLAKWLNTRKQISQKLRSENELKKSIASLNYTLNNLWREVITKQEQLELAWIYVNRAYLFEQNGYFLEAQADYIESDKIFTKLELESYNISRFVWHPLGNIYTRLGENELAVYYIQKALKKYKQLRETPDLVDAYNDIGIALINQNKYQSALDVLNRGIAMKIDDPINQALLFTNKAHALLELAELNQGEAVIDSAILFLKRATLLHSRNQYFLELISRYSINSHIIRGKLLQDLDRHEEALEEFWKALSFQNVFKRGKHRQLAKVYISLAKSQLSQGMQLEALNSFHQSLLSAIAEFNDSNILSNPSSKHLYAEVVIGEGLIGKAQAAEMQYFFDGNVQWLLLAMETYQLYFHWEKTIRSEYYYESSKLSFTKELHHATESVLELITLIQAANIEGDWGEMAFQFLEQSKGVLLSESEVNLYQQIPELKDDSVLFQLQLVKKQYELLLSGKSNNNMDRLEVLQKQIFNLENDLRQRFPYYIKTKSENNETLSIESLKEYLNRQDAKLSTYFVGEKSIYCILVRNDDFKLYSINKNHYDNLIFNFLKALYNPEVSVSIYQATSNDLYNLLCPYDTVDNKSRWIVIPDKELNLVPFEALVDRKRGGASSFKSLYYLVSRQVINYSPSAKFFLRKKELSKFPGSFLGIAPEFSGSSNSYLQYSAFEVEKIKNEFGGKIWTVDSIQKEKLIDELPNYQIVHWVSHAGIDSNIVNGAWIAVNSGDDYNSKLYPPDLFPLHLSTSLLTLNACNTASGKYKAGEGIYSLARGFAYAGAQNIVTNLWQANHEVNNQLMNSFYSILKRNGNISIALAEAKRRYLRSEHTDEFGAHPYFWASPILIGNNEILYFESGISSLKLVCIVLSGIVLFLLYFFILRRNNS